jgi:hypothetical protein
VAEVVPVWAAAPVWVAVLVEVLAPAVVPMVLARPFALTLFLLTSEKDADAHRSRCMDKAKQERPLLPSTELWSLYAKHQEDYTKRKPTAMNCAAND